MPCEQRYVSKIEKFYTAEQGCTCPILVILDDGRKAVVKYPNNPQGITVLLNEYISYHLSHILNIPSPAFGTAIIDNKTVICDDTKRITGNERFRGISFFCEYISTSIKASPRVLKNVTNLGESCKIILLDLVVKNVDRHAANILVDANNAQPKMYAIDYSHAFGGADWDESSLLLRDEESPYVWRENFDVYNMLIRANAPLSSTDFSSAAKLIRERITDDLLSRILADIPDAWIAAIGIDNIQHIRKYILHRVKNLDKICKMIAAERGV